MNTRQTTAAIYLLIVSLLAAGCNTNNKPTGRDKTVTNEQSNDDLFMNAQHPLSRRFAVLEDNGTSAWLYLTEPDTEKPCADAWVYNRVPAPSKEEVKSYRGGPPPAAIGYASKTAICESPAEHDWAFIWAESGDSVAVTKDGVPVACIVSHPKGNYCRELVKDGPWGKVWSDAEFDRVF